MVLHQLKGQKTEKISIMVSREEILQFCHVIGETHFLYTDVTLAQEHGYEDVLLPPTYPILFWQEISIPWLQLDAAPIHSEQSFHYASPLIANKIYDCHIEVIRSKKIGQQLFLKQRMFVTNESKTMLTSDTTLVLPLERKDA